MAPKQPALRFDHKEIAVIFSLFVFVALLMFTLGILVGKGLTMAKFEGKLGQAHQKDFAEFDTRIPDARQPASALPPTVEDTLEPLKPTEASTAAVPKYVPKNEPLELIPKKTLKHRARTGKSLLESKKSRAKRTNILKNPRVKALLEPRKFSAKAPSRPSPNRNPASVPNEINGQKLPFSLATGTHTVQVASYPNKKDAEARIAKLKTLGYANAYMSAKYLGDKKQTWFRVWLGYYPSYKAAEANAEFLQAKGEVKNYIVRKTDQTKG